MTRAVGRTAAVLAGLGAVGVGILAAVFWKDFAVQYHLWRLRRQSGYLMGIVEEPEGTRPRRAIRLFMESQDGQVALLQA